MWPGLKPGRQLARARLAAWPQAAVYILALVLSACSIDVSGLTPAATVARTAAPATAAVATLPVLLTQPPTLGPGPLPTQPPPTTAPTLSAPTLAAAESTPAPRTLPITWADRNLTGRLIFTAGTQGVLQLDLESGELSTLFTPPDPLNAWVVAAAGSPVSPTVVMAYAPPPPGGGIQLGYANLYSFQAGRGRLPEVLFSRVLSKETYFDPTWSPDGRWLYYVHLTSPVTVTANSRFAIERLEYPAGAAEVVVADAFWPRLSPDGSQLVYVHYDPVDGSNALFVAAADGSQSRQIELPAAFLSVDSPMFTPDSAAIVFSGNSGPAALSWLDHLLGVKLAYANGSPADWFSVPAAGGPAQQLTRMGDASMYGAFAPDGNQIAYISASGVHLMQVDGSGILQVLSAADLPGSVGAATLNWVP